MFVLNKCVGNVTVYARFYGLERAFADLEIYERKRKWGEGDLWVVMPDLQPPFSIFFTKMQNKSSAPPCKLPLSYEKYPKTHFNQHQSFDHL